MCFLLFLLLLLLPFLLFFSKGVPGTAQRIKFDAGMPAAPLR